MNLTQLTPDQMASLSNEELADVRDRAAYNAALVENRTVVSDKEAHRARRLRSLHHAAEREIAHRRTSRKTHQQKRRHHQPDIAPSLEGFIAFAESFPPSKRYSWIDCDNCLVAAYARSLGLDYAQVSRMAIPAPAGWTLEEPFTFDYLALLSQPNTYGAAANYARTLAAPETTAAAIEGSAS